jgi:pyruvate dehydrogenase E1 component alpha subunit
VLDPQGQLIGLLPQGLEQSQLLNWYRTMWFTRLFSFKLVALQRQGLSTTWIPGEGQEATSVGIATPLLPQDWLACSPREVGAYFLKGFSPAAVAYFARGYPPPAELCGNDVRCMPLYIVIGTQSLHAVGLAMAAKLKGDDAVVVVAVGDGAASEGDFSEAMNFAGVYKAPVVLVVVNNGWAISVPRHKQSAVRQIAWRGKGFGMEARLVDGNDILAVYSVMQEAVARARAGEGPTLVEAVTYRIGAHSTADDPGRYRPAEELAYWQARDPLARFRRFLKDRQVLDEAADTALRAEIEAEVNEQVRIAHEYPIPGPDGFFEQVYHQTPPRLQRQRTELNQLLQTDQK